MPSIILSDNGVSSGSAGLKSTAASDGALSLQTTTAGGTATTAISISNTQVVTYTNQPTYSGGTANGVAYLNGSKVLTTGSALVFDGTNLSTTGSISLNNNAGSAYYLRNAAGNTTFGYLYSDATNLFLTNQANGYLAFATNNTERMRLDSAGNLGLGVTPSAWNNIFKAIQVNAQGALMATSASMQMGNNIYYDGAYKFIGTGYANRYYQATGQHVWTVSTASGSAGGAVTETQAMTLDASGNLGVGTSSPGAKQELYVSRTSSTNAVALILNDNVTGAQTNGVYKAIRSLSNNGASVSEVRFLETDGTNNNTGIAFATSPSAGSLTERARIDSSGNLLVGTTSNNSTSRTVIRATQNVLNLDNAGGQYTTLTYSNNDVAKAYVYYDNTNTRTYVQTGASGGVYLASGGTSWTAVSDERVKDIIEPIENANQKIASWRTVIGKYKADTESVRRSFLIAQDVLETFPEAVDSTNADEYGLNYQDLIPVLVKAIQEQQSIIQQLQADVAALKGAQA